MQSNRLTTKSREALQSAVGAASRRGNPELLPEHLLLEIITQGDGIGQPLLQLAGADVEGDCF
jgi:ATP-dependent Clp protease ATP-binding subunit ClpB